MHLPLSTYRIQFNKDFTFKHFKNIIPYLDSLGITTIYAAPILQAAPGSMHGYDVTDPQAINPEIGTLEELTEISAMLKERSMGWLQDIVPNHMAFDRTNARLMDVLERGESSPYYRYFDIDWNHPSPELTGKIMIPVLGKELAACIKNGEIKLSFSEDGFTIDYFDTRYPLSVAAYKLLAPSDDSAALRNIFDALVEKAAQQRSINDWKKLKGNFFDDLRSKRQVVDLLVKKINGDPEILTELLTNLSYVLVFWKKSSEVMNYRRFFTVNSLICLRMEDDDVFRDYHHFLHHLRTSGLVDGFRIDHIDGLLDPTTYIKRLRNLVGIDTYIVAEKILEEREGIPLHWDIEGTSGYEFLAYVSQLFTDRIGGRKILGFYKSLVPGLPGYKELVVQNKRLILKEHMAGEWQNLVRLFTELGLRGAYAEQKIKEAIGLIMLSLPVYRIYPDGLPLRGEDRKVIEAAFIAAQSLESDCHDELRYLESLFLEDSRGDQVEVDILHFLRRLMQFTGPLTAKGVEDTTFYVYSPLISHDEVGDAPSRLGISVGEFHRKMIDRHRQVPLALNATSTHDTKRGEDARIRLNILSEFPQEWIEHVNHWMVINQKFTTTIGQRTAPEANEMYFIYQSLVGGFPDDFVVTPEFIERIHNYLTKVIREAKVNSSWESPDQAYEEACLNFVSGIMHDENGFLKSFIPFIRKISGYAGAYSLGQTLVKITAPGIPDIYQGTELWDLSFVDPDNRRPVDYELRMRLLDDIESLNDNGALQYALDHHETGTAKLFVTMRALRFRKNNGDVFLKGSYIPLEISGDNVSVLAYARRYGQRWVLVMVPLSFAATLDGCEVILPAEAPSTWREVFTNEVISVSGRLTLQRAIGKLRVAMLYND